MWFLEEDGLPETELLDPLLKWLAEAGFSGVELESREKLLIVKLPPSLIPSLLQNSELRIRFIQEAKKFGFLRVVLEIQ